MHPEQLLIHGQKVKMMTLSWIHTTTEGKMTAQIVVVMKTRLMVQKRRGEKKQELHLKVPLLNVISVKAHTCGKNR